MQSVMIRSNRKKRRLVYRKKSSIGKLRHSAMNTKKISYRIRSWMPKDKTNF